MISGLENSNRLSPDQSPMTVMTTSETDNSLTESLIGGDNESPTTLNISTLSNKLSATSHISLIGETTRPLPAEPSRVQSKDSNLSAIILMNIYCLAMTTNSTFIKKITELGVSPFHYQFFRGLTFTIVLGLTLAFKGVNPFRFSALSKSNSTRQTIILLLVRVCAGLSH